MVWETCMHRFIIVNSTIYLSICWFACTHLYVEVLWSVYKQVPILDGPTSQQLPNTISTSATQLSTLKKITEMDPRTDADNMKCIQINIWFCIYPYTEPGFYTHLFMFQVRHFADELQMSKTKLCFSSGNKVPVFFWGRVTHPLPILKSVKWVKSGPPSKKKHVNFNFFMENGCCVWSSSERIQSS